MFFQHGPAHRFYCPFFYLLMMFILWHSVPGFPCIHQPGENSGKHILIISRPKLWAAPDRDSTATAQQWNPGKGIQVHETKTTTDATSNTQITWHRIHADGREGWLPAIFVAPPPPPLNPESLEKIGGAVIDRERGVHPDYAPKDLMSVGPRYDPEVDFRMRREAAKALRKMFRAAKKEGIKLFVVSAYRSWEKQQELYQKRVCQNGWLQRTVAKPGHSEHQLGLAVDLTGEDKERLLRESFGETKEGKWLRDHAWAYGFAVSYTSHNQNKTGYAPEPWHYRYWGVPLAGEKHAEALGISE